MVTLVIRAAGSAETVTDEAAVVTSASAGAVVTPDPLGSATSLGGSRTALMRAFAEELFETTPGHWSVCATSSLLLSFDDASEVIDVLRSTQADIPPLSDCRRDLIEAALARPGQEWHR
jgi:hypothetical protein